MNLEQQQSPEDFLDAYAYHFNCALGGSNKLTDETAKAFAGCFVAANSHGITCGRNDEKFREAIASGKTMAILSKTVTPLDELHTMIRVTWCCRYSNSVGVPGEIRFDNIYFLQRWDNSWVIFGYVTGNEEKAFKEAGLVLPEH